MTTTVKRARDDTQSVIIDEVIRIRFLHVILKSNIFQSDEKFSPEERQVAASGEDMFVDSKVRLNTKNMQRYLSSRAQEMITRSEMRTATLILHWRYNSAIGKSYK